ncbi:MscS Mechanosensitive ion channel [Gloeothece citriformis PCC 7424]|uniref:MscS Mechanosensitive ion channel n=1 Tax=Gloeothece citriformis (strain PCC 7424) TaxID=65393 RepID=B7K894_GLOC7|nr:mechanosensitive ion channel domain-containing protein [Gloeothece citriformis]ACK69854.1 MscS Mechanosensitive ion channel [Gloeothece citriformis PCC 7424]
MINLLESNTYDITLGLFIGALGVIGTFLLPKVAQVLINKIISPPIKDIYLNVAAPDQNLIWAILITSVVDIAFLIVPAPDWLEYGEIVIGLVLSAGIIWLGVRVFKRFFDIYFIEAAFQNNHKINSEVLSLIKFTVNSIFVLIVVFIFTQTHKINIFGLIASLGISGLAIAFAAKTIIEQILGGIVIYIDRPFVTDDYIGLPDGTFGRVESIGIRSTKIRTSGKGTLVIVPNNSLTQMSIENFTGAKKILSLLYLTFYNPIPQEEKALIRQVILDSTSDIFGIDSRSTEVIFKDIISTGNGTKEITQAQINFFILGSGDVSMDLRRQLLDIARQSIAKQLKDYGIAFEIEDKTLNVESPITI